MEKRQRYYNCEICGLDISKRRRGTRACSPEHSLELLRRYHQVYYQKNHLKYAEKLKDWRAKNPDKWKEQRQRAYAKTKAIYDDIRRRQAQGEN